MKYLSVQEIAKKWNISVRSVRNYCSQNRVEGAILKGKTWYIPSDAKKPQRLNSIIQNPLYEVLLREKQGKIKGGIYYTVQLELTYNSNHIEGSRLTFDETRYIYETKTILHSDENHRVDDIIETVNHFRCVDFIIENANKKLTEAMIKKIHFLLESGTTNSDKKWFNVGAYKSLPNVVGEMKTTPPEKVAEEIKKLIDSYNKKKLKTFIDILDFHYHFEKIHPFQDGNGRVGRLIMFKECLCNNIIPFIVKDEYKSFYYRGLKMWEKEKGDLKDTCLSFQDDFKKHLDYFRIKY